MTDGYNLRYKQLSSSVDEESFFEKTIEKLLLSDVFINKICDKITSLLTPFIQTEVKVLATKVEQLQTQLNVTNSKLDDMEQYSRSNNLRLYGVPEKQDENINEVISTFCSEKLDIVLQPHDIDVSHRLKSKVNGTRPIIVRFTSRAVKHKIYNNKRKLKGSRIIIKEDLTKVRVQLLKEISKRAPARSTWTRDGKIYCKVNNKIQLIRCIDDIRKIWGSAGTDVSEHTV